MDIEEFLFCFYSDEPCWAFCMQQSQIFKILSVTISFQAVAGEGQGL